MYSQIAELQEALLQPWFYRLILVLVISSNYLLPLKKALTFFIQDYRDKTQELVSPLSLQPSNTVAARYVVAKGNNMLSRRRMMKDSLAGLSLVHNAVYIVTRLSTLSQKNVNLSILLIPESTTMSGMSGNPYSLHLPVFL